MADAARLVILSLLKDELAQLSGGELQRNASNGVRA
jgi:translation initiation factor RLI1